MSQSKGDLTFYGMVLGALVLGGIFFLQGAQPPTPPPATSPEVRPSMVAPSTAAPPTPTAAPRKLAVLADETGMTPDVPPSMRWTSFVAEALGLHPVVFGSRNMGYAVAQSPERCVPPDCGPFGGFLDRVVALDPAAVLIVGGYHDAATDRAAGLASSRDLLDALAERLPNARVIVVNPMQGNGDFVDLKPFATELRTLVNDHNNTWLEIGDPVHDAKAAGKPLEKLLVQSRLTEAVVAQLKAQDFPVPLP